MPDVQRTSTAPTQFSRRVAVPSGIFAATPPPAFLLFDDQGARIDPVRDWLRDGPRTAHVVPSDLEALHQHLRATLHAIVSFDAVPPTDRAWAVHRALLSATAVVMRGDEKGVAAAHLTAACRELAVFLLQQPGQFFFLDVIAGSRYTAVTRSVETAIFAAALAAADGVKDRDHLTAIALGGIFADFGKLGMPSELLSRSGPLADEEWQRIREHPRRSVEVMRRFGVITAGAVRGALNHHERWDGEGYPEKLRGEDIPIEGRYLAIADAYSALTVDRPFSEHRESFGALTEMAQSKGQFEPRLLRLFVPLLYFSEPERSAESAEPAPVEVAQAAEAA